VELTNEIQCVHDPMWGEHRFRAEDFPAEAEVRPPHPSVFEVFDYVQERLGGERYLASPSGGITGGGVMALESLGGIEHGLTMYALQPEVIVAFNRRSLAVQNALDPFYIRSGSPGVIIEEDTAGTNAPLVSPKMFREMVFPFFRQRVEHIKQFAPQVIFHNCGQNMPLMEMFIEAGVDCYQSLQTTAGMEIGLLKQRFGDRLCFWGGMAVETLIEGQPGDVRRQVRTAMERGAPGGGFIFGPSHSIAKGAKYENFMTMLDEFVKLRDKF
jgi:uroporphyrinogen decarboxylase